ncbi:MAG TPA: M90 family metallopeptidase [Candidatus Binatia bacterium]|nr:M90 family metallopeptidase [Candidatus Binatia bacterium]
MSWLRRLLRRGPAPFAPAWRALLERRLPQHALLDAVLLPRFEARVQDFLRRKRFYGCDGLVVTEEMRVLVAGVAALLVLREDAAAYPQLRSVLLYPRAFWVRHREPYDIGGDLELVSDEEQLQLGESQDVGRVVLSWEDVQAALAGDPVHVAAHEFAHQLNDENPGIEGAPPLADYGRWSRVMEAALQELGRRGSPVLDEYGLEGPAEFFAVATEAYLQRGALLQRHHPELYALLRDYYLLDTAQLRAH